MANTHNSKQTQVSLVNAKPVTATTPKAQGKSVTPAEATMIVIAEIGRFLAFFNEGKVSARSFALALNGYAQALKRWGAEGNAAAALLLAKALFGGAKNENVGLLAKRIANPTIALPAGLDEATLIGSPVVTENKVGIRTVLQRLDTFYGVVTAKLQGQSAERPGYDTYVSESGEVYLAPQASIR